MTSAHDYLPATIKQIEGAVTVAGLRSEEIDGWLVEEMDFRRELLIGPTSEPALQIVTVLEAELKGLDVGTDRSKFERKVRTYLRSHDDNLVVQKLLRGRRITSADLDELQSIFLDLGFGTEADIDRTAEEHENFGLFLRAITGLSRETAIQAFSDFRRGRTLSPAEYAFVDLIIEFLTQNGYLDVGELYEPPFKQWGTQTWTFAMLHKALVYSGRQQAPSP